MWNLGSLGTVGCFIDLVHKRKGISNLNIQCNQRDLHSLQNFKQRAIDPSSFLSSWTYAQDCCKWKGVQCNNITGRVTELSLPCLVVLSTYSASEDKSKCLTGELDLQSLLDLESLTHLDLSSNNFKKVHLPNSSSNYNIQYLNLSDNYVSMDGLGWISGLPSLKYLDLSYIDVHKETSWLQCVSSLPSLVELHLRGCVLEDMSPSLEYANFSSLLVLDLSENYFSSELPVWLFNLRRDFSSLDLSRNSLRGRIPSAMSALRSMKYLFLHHNRLSGPLPDWLVQLKHLQELDLSFNSFLGSIPKDVGKMSSLTVLDLRSNVLNGSLPESLGQLSNLETLYVGDNSFEGVVSEVNFANLSELKNLHLSSPSIIFDFDSQWVPPFQLDSIVLGFVSPKLPSWIYTQKSLTYLKIINSILTHEAQDKFWNFVAQVEQRFTFSYNTLNDWDLSKVLLNSRFMILESNSFFKGGLPSLSPNVTVFSLYNNSLSGSISPLLCQNMNFREISNLMSLDLSQNHFSGGITNCWKNWKSLVHVNLGSNNLTGKIPNSMGSLSNLISLHLHENNMLGEIPHSLQNCQKLWILNLRENNFSGKIPNWVPQSSVILQLRSNQFSGNIPPQICQLSSLKILDFAENKLSGTIPPCLQNLTSMVYNNASYDTSLGLHIEILGVPYIFQETLLLLIKGQESEYKENLKFIHFIDLSKNDLSGKIPFELFGLTGLQSLNLSHNRLEGEIPQRIGELNQLESLDLSSNQLVGEIPESLSRLSFLSSLNLSFNNLIGKIPLGTQIQSFEAWSFVGNPQLCGAPLTRKCEDEEDKSKEKYVNDDDDDGFEFLKWFYIGMGCGFVIGFGGFLSLLCFNKRWRHAYFIFLDHIKDRLYVIIAVKMKSF
ncbi:receptor-like protein EIX2 [Senna tora]|uniref:Receptor-like protein EIX2 n=1 Tax=Senna tora TaxID=362788 RepID=A0A834TEV0_9FABA|nr:receptor-like protein EIX2 [Senna tora]